MKLPKMRYLMGLLARDMQRKQVKEMLAALPPSCISQTEREDCKSAISFFILLKKRTGTDEAFLSKLETVLSECNCADFLSSIRLYKEQNPDLFQEPPSQLSLPDGTRSGFKPKPGQSDKFRSILLRISRTVGKKQLEIMVALSPTPEAGKQNISEGHELFAQMERHGCISENDTEMLQEMLELLRLQDAIKFLYDYHQDFPPILHDPEPSAPNYASLPSSVQVQYGSLPEHGSQYLSQPQSFLPSQPRSLPSFSPSGGPGGQIGPSSSTSSGHQPSYSSQPSLSINPQPSLGQGYSLSSTLSGGSSTFGPPSQSSSSSSSKSYSAPAPSGAGRGYSSPCMESGEQNFSLSSRRKFVPGVSPSFERQSLAAAMRAFPQEGEGSAASLPSQAPSSVGSNDIYARPMATARKRRHLGDATPNGSLHYEDNHSAPISVLSSGTYPRPMQEMQRSYQFPTNEVLDNREHALISSQSLPKEDDDTTAPSPPPAKIPRSSDQHVGDGGCLSTQRGRTQPSNHGQASSASASSSQAPETGSLSTLSSFTGGSDKFEPGLPVSPSHNPNPGGSSSSSSSSAVAGSQNSLESYHASLSFPLRAEGEQVPSASVGQLQQPAHNNMPAPIQIPPPHNPYYPHHSASAASSNLSYSSSINIRAGEQPHSANLGPSLPHLESAAAGGPVSNASSQSVYSGEVSLPAPVQQGMQPQRLDDSIGGLGGDSRNSSLGDQFRNAVPSGFAERARHRDDLVGLQQPFHYWYAGQSASVAGSPMPSLSSYRGHPSANFAHDIQEQGGSENKVPPISDSKKTQICEDENLINNFSPTIGEDVQCSKAQIDKSLASQNSATSEMKEKEYQETVEGNNAERGTQPTRHQQRVNAERGNQLTRYQQQNHDFQKRYPKQGPPKTEHGRSIAQASSENNVELRNAGSMQGALATAKEGEQTPRQPASSENLLFQTAGSNQLYPKLPPDTSTGTSTSSGAALVGSKRTRSQCQKVEGSGERREEEQGTTKKQKTTKKQSRTKKKRGVVSRVMGYIFGNSTSTDDQSQEEEGCETTESETEYHSAKED